MASCCFSLNTCYFTPSPSKPVVGFPSSVTYFRSCFRVILARYELRSVVLSDGAVLIMGGYADAPMNDVWRSEDGGYKWVIVTSTAAWRGNCDTAFALEHLLLILFTLSYDLYSFCPIQSAPLNVCRVCLSFVVLSSLDTVLPICTAVKCFVFM